MLRWEGKKTNERAVNYALNQGSQTQISPRAKWGLINNPSAALRLPGGPVMMLTKQWRYLNFYKQFLHLISCERYRKTQIIPSCLYVRSKGTCSLVGRARINTGEKIK